MVRIRLALKSAFSLVPVSYMLFRSVWRGKIINAPLFFITRLAQALRTLDAQLVEHVEQRTECLKFVIARITHFRFSNVFIY